MRLSDGTTPVGTRLARFDYCADAHEARHHKKALISRAFLRWRRGESNPRVVPHESEVLAAVRPGHVVRIPLRPEQRKQLSDDEGRLALSLLQHTLEARTLACCRFPFTGGFVQRLSRRLGQPVGEHKALRMVRRLIEADVLLPSGSYRQAYDTRQPSGFRVRLFQLGTLLRNKKSSVRRSRARGSWWTHPLFGFGSESFPKWLPKYLRRCHPPP